MGNNRPLIGAKLDEVYQSNSGINISSITLLINGILINLADINIANGNLDAIISYNPTFDLNNGTNNVTINASDKSGRNSQLTWQFTVLFGEQFNLTVYSPENINYAKKNIPFNITTAQNAELIEFINWNDKKPKFKKLCSNCGEYGYNKSRTQKLNEGENNITIRASDGHGLVLERNISLFIDSRIPKISKTEPKKNSVTNGSNFLVKYSEENLKNVSIIFNPNITITGCQAGINKLCATTLNLSDFDGSFIEYYFELSDLINTARSKPVKVLVDTTSPEITLYLPQNASYSGKVPFNITITEEVELDYYDSSDSNPRWNRLCSKCDDYGFLKLKTKTFKEGNHSIAIRATDKAGNSDNVAINLTIV